MRSDETDRHFNLNLGSRLGMCVAAAVLAGAGAFGCSSGSGAASDGSSTGTGGTIGTGTGGIKADAGTGGAKGDGGVVATVNALGTACKTSTDCAAGLTCLAPTDKTFGGVGGAANGYCSVACSSNADCGASGSCVNIGTQTVAAGFCFLNCTPGTLATGATKCNTRPDVACSPLTDSAGAAHGAACFPVCSQDSDCPTGRKCDDAIGLCVDTPSTGLPFGAHCTYDPTGTATDMCAGGCLGIGGAAPNTVVASFCTRRCVADVLENCNWVGAGMSLATGGAHGVCLPSSDTDGAGDNGVCFQECDKAADCGDQTDPALSCDLSAMAVIGHGICVWGATSTDGGVSDGAGQ